LIRFPAHTAVELVYKHSFSPTKFKGLFELLFLNKALCSRVNLYKSVFPIKAMRVLFPLIFLLLFSSTFAATLEGKVVAWQTLAPLELVVVDVEGASHQRIVATNGRYSLSLVPGDYALQAIYYENNYPVLYALETISLPSDTGYTFDLVLFPVSGEDVNRLTLLGGAENFGTQPTPDPVGFVDGYLGAGLLVLIVVGFLYYFRKQLKKNTTKNDSEKMGEELTKEQDEPFDQYCREVVAILKRSGNRLTQKELREKMDVGEAKVSLIISELEEAGKVKKIKQGRGNIIVLNDRPAKL
jgi:uncharacterized membrane protein